jgi:alanyl-tRNA synthetase
MTGDLANTAHDVGGIKVVAARVEGLDAKALRDGVDQLKQQLTNCVVLLAGASDGRVSLVAGVNGQAAGRIKAGDVVAHVANQIEGKGGGRPDMAQGGGLDKPQLPDILNSTVQWIGKQLAG